MQLPGRATLVGCGWGMATSQAIRITISSICHDCAVVGPTVLATSAAPAQQAQEYPNPGKCIAPVDPRGCCPTSFRAISSAHTRLRFVTSNTESIADLEDGP